MTWRADLHGRARGVGDGGAGATELSADARPGQPHCAIAIAIGSEARAEEDLAVHVEGAPARRGQQGLVMVAPEQSRWPPMCASASCTAPCWPAPLAVKPSFKRTLPATWRRSPCRRRPQSGW